MALFRDFTTLLFLLACFEFSYFVSAAPSGPTGAVLSPSAQTLVNQTVSWQQATGQQWDLLAAEALLTLVKFVETNGLPSPSCTLDNVYVRKEW
jgi:hypothetical protein